MAHYDATLVVGIIASATSLGLVILRQTDFWRIHKQKTIEELHPYMYMTYLFSYTFWTLYCQALLCNGVTKLTGTNALRLEFLYFVNAIGMLWEIWHICMIIGTTPEIKKRIITGGFLGADMVLFLANCKRRRSDIFGPIAVVFGIMMHATPLFVIRNIYKTKSIGCLSFSFCLASFLDGIVWFIFAFLPTIHLYLAIANGIGILLGIVQLGLLCKFREKTRVYDAQSEGMEIV